MLGILEEQLGSPAKDIEDTEMVDLLVMQDTQRFHLSGPPQLIQYAWNETAQGAQSDGSIMARRLQHACNALQAGIQDEEGNPVRVVQAGGDGSVQSVDKEHFDKEQVNKGRAVIEQDTKVQRMNRIYGSKGGDDARLNRR